ncbi:MAG: tetratricopeptide repeat protein [Gammaproteobacteria bacterium]|nr:MAG: tetratricopeptide repeat protein [Gammaproteobacteria bacterium]
MNTVLALISRFATRWLALAVLVAAGTSFGGGFAGIEPARAQAPGEASEEAEQRRTQRVPAMREQAFNRLSEAQEAMDEGDIPKALDVLRRMSEQRGLNAYEAASMWNMRAYIYFSQDDYPRAIEAYERILTFSPEVPLALELGTMYALGQLYFVQEDYRKAIEYLNRWFDLVETPSPQAYIFLAQAYYQLNEFREVIPPVQQAMAMTRERDGEVRENWWLLKRAAYYEMEDWGKVIDIIEILVRDFPSKDYWVQLSGLYGQQEQQKKQVATIWTAYMQGYLDQEREILNLTGLLQQEEAPYWAARILEREIENGVVEANRRNLQGLAQAWQMAQNVEKAIPAYHRAAERADDGELHYRLAQLYLDRDDCERSIQAADRAISRGGVDREGQVYLVKGMCQYNLGRFEAAVSTFGEGLRVARRERSEQDINALTQWRTHVEREQRRQEQLARADGPA